MRALVLAVILVAGCGGADDAAPTDGHPSGTVINQCKCHSAAAWESPPTMPQDKSTDYCASGTMRTDFCSMADCAYPGAPTRDGDGITWGQSTECL